MEHGPGRHQWGKSYEYLGTTYRECMDPGCACYQQWICADDRWSDAFDTLSPRARDERNEQERIEHRG